MFGINYWAVVVASVAAFLASTVWYLVFAKQWRELSAAKSGATDNRARHPNPMLMLSEIIRNLILALVLAYLVLHLGEVTWIHALLLGFILWLGFPVILLTGSILRENYPWKLAAIHAGDWFVKLVLISGIVSLWH